MLRASRRASSRTLGHEFDQRESRIKRPSEGLPLQGRSIEYWHVTAVAPDPRSGLGVYVKPYQQPHPPIAVAGTNVDSGTLQIAGERSWIPMSSSQMPIEGLISRWHSVELGAQRTGRTADRRQWRVARQVHVAETTAAARRDVLEGVMARAHLDYLHQGMKASGRLAVLKTDPHMPDDAVNAEFLLERNWVARSMKKSGASATS